MNNPKIYFRLLVFFIVLTWCVGFSLKVLTSNSGFSIASTPVLNLFYHNMCHQDESKLISISGINFLVCARCSGIYIGALLSSMFMVLLFRKNSFSLKILSVTSLILLIDVVLNNFILDKYNRSSAFITGLLFGSACFLIVINTIEENFFIKAGKN